MTLFSDFNDPNIWTMWSFFPDSDNKHSILHKTLNLISPCIVRQLEPAHELTIFSAYLKNPVIINENYDFIPGDPWKVSFEHMCSWSFSPVELSPKGWKNFTGETREMGGKE